MATTHLEIQDKLLIRTVFVQPDTADRIIELLESSVAGGVTTFNTLSGAVTISAGSGVTLTPVGNNIAISASGGSGDIKADGSVPFTGAESFNAGLLTDAITGKSGDMLIQSFAGASLTVQLDTGTESVVFDAVHNVITISAAVGVVIASDTVSLSATTLLDLQSTAGTVNIIGTTGVIINDGGAGGGIDMSATDGLIALPAGLVSNVSIGWGIDFGMYKVSNTQIGFASASALVGGFDGNGLFTNQVTEQTVGVGVVINTSIGDITLLPVTGFTASTVTSPTKGGLADASTLGDVLKWAQGIENALFGSTGILHS